MFAQRSRHHLLQRLFWNPLVAPLVPFLIRIERMFDVVVRNYSLIGETNGERWILSLMDEQPVAFDIGFNEGASTAEILRARPMARVMAFDPSRFALKNYHTRFADDERVTFENLGVSNTVGKARFYDYESGCNSLTPRKDVSGPPESTYQVWTTTLDTYCQTKGIDQINLLKIDTEGFDLNALEGAYELLSKEGVDIFMFEFASGWASAKRYLWEVDEYFKPLPYTLYHLFNGFLAPFVYDARIDSCCTLSCMYVGISHRRLSRGDIPLRKYDF